jgi:NADH dehydrogenase
MAGCTAVIHLVGIIMEKPSKGITFERIHFEGTRAVVDAAKRNGIGRFIHMSALGTRPNAASQYHQTKWKAEECVRASGIDWTIFRPGLIHGPGGLMEMEAKWAHKSAPPFVAMPYFGKGALGLGGSGLLQPVYVDDVARAFVEAIDRPQSIRKTYDLAGPDRLNWPQFHHVSSLELIGKQRMTAPLPAWIAKLLASAGLGPLLDFNRDQVIMSQEDNVGDPTPFEADFGWKLRPFRESLREYASGLQG